MIRRALIDSVIYAVAAVLSRILTILQVPMFIGIVSVKDFGLLDIVLVAVNLLNLTVAFEISQGVAIYFSESKSEKEKVAFASTSLWFTLACYIAFTLVAWPFADELFHTLLGERARPELAELFLMLTFASGIFLLTINQLRWMLSAKRYFVASLLYAVLNIGFSCFYVYYQDAGAAGLISAYIIASIGASILAVYYARDYFKFVFSLEALKKMLIFSLPLVPSSLCVFFSLYVDRLCIKELLGLEEVGLYGIAYRAASMVGIVIVGFSRAFTPLIYNNSADADTPSKVEVLFRVYMYFGLLFLIALGLFSREIIIIMAGIEYISAHNLVPLIAGSLIVANIYVLAPGLSLAKKTKTIAGISILTAFLNFILNLGLIPLLGIDGSALATLLTSVISAYLWIILGQKLYPIPFSFRNLFISGLILSAAVAVNFNLTFDLTLKSLAVKSLLGAGVAGASLFLIFSRSEINAILHKPFGGKAVVD